MFHLDCNFRDCKRKVLIYKCIFRCLMIHYNCSSVLMRNDYFKEEFFVYQITVFSDKMKFRRIGVCRLGRRSYGTKYQLN